MATTTFGNTAPSALRDRLNSFAETLQAKLEQRRTFHRTRRELQSLSDRELSDLGINRSLITSIAMEAAYGK